MAKVTVTVCDNCREQIINPNYPYIVLVEGGDTTLRGELCETCVHSLGLHGLPERQKRQYKHKASA